MRLSRTTTVPAGAVALAAVIAVVVASCSGGGSTSHGAGNTVVEGVDASACKTLSAQVSQYRLVEQDNGTNLNAGALRHSPSDKWTVTGPVVLDGKDPIDVVPWLKLTNPGSEPAECKSPVTAPDAGKKPYTEVLLFPAKPGVQASLTKQFRADDSAVTNSPNASRGPAMTGITQVSHGALRDAISMPTNPPPYNVDVDILTTFSYGGKNYVVLYRDPVVTGVALEAPNSGPDGVPAPSADNPGSSRL